MFSGWTMLKSFCHFFFNFSSTSKRRTPIHSYRQDEEDGQNSFSNFIFFFFFFFLKFKIQLLFYVNPRVTVMKVLLYVFAGAMVDLSTPLVLCQDNSVLNNVVSGQFCPEQCCVGTILS